MEALVRTWGPRALTVARQVPFPLLAGVLTSPFLRRFRGTPDAIRVRSPDLFTDVAQWGKHNPELVATLALGVGALLGTSRMRLLKAGLAFLPRVLPHVTANLFPKPS